RWIHPAAAGWFSGDHHIHAAGCAHYESPTEGVTPEDMMRHVLGEDLNVGCCLSWGPCWYHQKRYFEGKVNALSTPTHLLRFDVAHGMCDFMSTVDTPSVWELNMWYHTLNCGYRARISGETDFPCIYGEKVGLGRSYVHLDGKLDFDQWVAGIKQGRCYVGD